MIPFSFVIGLQMMQENKLCNQKFLDGIIHW